MDFMFSVPLTIFLKVTDIKSVDKPSSDEYVYPPDDSYIPTAGIL